MIVKIEVTGGGSLESATPNREKLQKKKILHEIYISNRLMARLIELTLKRYIRK